MIFDHQGLTNALRARAMKSYSSASSSLDADVESKRDGRSLEEFTGKSNRLARVEWAEEEAILGFT